MLFGPPGLGKTTLAALIAHDLHRSLRPTSGPTLEKPKDLVGILTSLEEGDVLFIDEIHRLGSVVEEFLYPAMEEFQIDFVVDRGAYAKTFAASSETFYLDWRNDASRRALCAAARALWDRASSRFLRTKTSSNESSCRAPSGSAYRSTKMVRG